MKARYSLLASILTITQKCTSTIVADRNLSYSFTQQSTHRQASRQLTAERPVCFCFFTLPEVELTISRNLPF